MLLFTASLLEIQH